MGKTLANLRDALAGALGFSYSELETQDAADVDTIINASYLDCFASKDGRRQAWAVQYWSDVTKAPAAATLSLVNGSTLVTGFTFEAKYVGSFVKLGDAFYRLGSVDGATYNLLQPWSGTTGDHSATVYYNAILLPGTGVKVMGAPSLLGVGPLNPMPFPEDEIKLRSSPSFDFQSRSGRVPFTYSRPRFNQSLITDVGDPRYFHVDSGAMGATFATSSRFHVYPLPSAAFTIEARMIILPSPLTETTDEPLLPHDDVDVTGAILMPFMFERLLKHPLGRRYSGNNIGAIFKQADDARSQLNTFRSVQNQGPKQVRPACGW